MESSNHNRILIVEDANVSTFRRRNKILILLLWFLIISLILIILFLIITLVRTRSDTPQSYISPLEAYCHVSDKDLCLTTLNPIITNRFISNPNQIFTISLQTAAKSLQHIISSVRSNSVFGNCSNSLPDALDLIRDPMATMQVNPFVEALSDEQRGDMINRIMVVEENVRSCVDDLANIEAAAVGEVAAELLDVKVYLNGAGDFLFGYAEVLLMYEADNAVDRRMISENLSGLCLCGLQLLFVFCLFCSLFRTR